MKIKSKKFYSIDSQSTRLREFIVVLILIFITPQHSQPSLPICDTGVREMVIDDVIGEDGRVGVVDTTAFPYRAIAKLIIFFGGNDYEGTGVLVGRNHLLTAAHNIYHSWVWASSVYVIPGKAGFSEPYGQAVATDMHVFSEYLSGNVGYDIGLIEFFFFWDGWIMIDHQSRIARGKELPQLVLKSYGDERVFLYNSGDYLVYATLHGRLILGIHCEEERLPIYYLP